MRAGGLRYKLRLLRPTATTNDYGAEKTTYEPTAVVWAERVKFDGSQSNEVGEHFPITGQGLTSALPMRSGNFGA